MSRAKKSNKMYDETDFASTSIEWIDLGIQGLDRFIPGLPKGDAILVRGEPGTGKTICCLQYVKKGIDNGERVIYITTEETPKTIIRTANELWPGFQDLVDEEKIVIINMSINATYASAYSLINKEEAIQLVKATLDKYTDISRIVIDSISSLKRRLADENDFREVYMKLLLETKATGATVLLSAEGIPMTPDITEYLVDHLIYLDYVKHDVMWTRVFILRKSRSVPLKPQILRLNIEKWGLSVEEIPISLKPVWFQSKL